MDFAFDCIDHLTKDECFAFWAKYQNPTRKAAAELFGGSHVGYIRAAKDLANYASNKGAAIGCRTQGDTSRALMYEGICDKIYAGLPDFARW